MPAPAKRKSRFWRRCRIAFRRFRLTIWFITLLLLGGLIYLNLIGLPSFIERPLLVRLQERGMDVRFKDLRLHWVRGFVAEQVQFGASASITNPAVPRFTAREVEVNFLWRGIFSGKLPLDYVTVRGGELQWTLLDSTAPAAPLTVDQIVTRVRVRPGDLILLDELQGRFAGVNFRMSAAVTNASALREWTAAGGPRPEFDPEQWSRRLRGWSDVLAQISFATPPDLRLDISGDARDPLSFQAWLMLRAAQADTAWGKAQEIGFKTQIVPAGTNPVPSLDVSLTATRIETRWASTGNLNLKWRLKSQPDHPERIESHLALLADAVDTPWTAVTGFQLKAGGVFDLNRQSAEQGRLECFADTVAAPFARVTTVNLTADWQHLTNALAADPTLGAWTNWWPYRINLALGTGPIRSAALVADRFECAAEWAAPNLVVHRWDAGLYRGTLTATGQLDVVTRATQLAGAASFDLNRIAPLLGPAAEKWLSQLTWDNPPRLEADAAFTLPAWTHRSVDWKSEMQSSLKLAVAVAATNATFRGVSAKALVVRLGGTNQDWHVPEFHWHRNDGDVRVALRANTATRDFHVKFASTMAVRAFAPLLGPEVQRGLDLCEFTQAPVVSGELWGRGDDWERLGFAGYLALTNFSFRNEALDAVIADVRYTNRVLEVISPRGWRGDLSAQADSVEADFNQERIFLNNATGCFPPRSIVTMVGPVVAKVMEPYHFLTPPTARVHGYVPMRGHEVADVTFAGRGRTFEALNFQATDYEAEVIWRSNLLTVTNATAGFYDGKARGWAQFDFPPHGPAPYVFAVSTTNSRLSPLAAAVTGRTNQLEGRLTGWLTVTNATTESLNTWRGSAQATIKDGLLWELPILGVLSAPLDAIMPGVGKSRFTIATGTFGIADGVVETRNLELRASNMRLQYRGIFGLDGRLNARVTAEPLRDTPVLGPVVSTVLSPVARLFAYRITGTRDNPVSEPIYIPGPVISLFSPFQTIGNLFSSSPTVTNAPATPVGPPDAK
jgi:hypothetical protein